MVIYVIAFLVFQGSKGISSGTYYLDCERLLGNSINIELYLYVKLVFTTSFSPLLDFY